MAYVNFTLNKILMLLALPFGWCVGKAGGLEEDVDAVFSGASVPI